MFQAVSFVLRADERNHARKEKEAERNHEKEMKKLEIEFEERKMDNKRNGLINFFKIYPRY